VTYLQFARRRNNDSYVDSICPRCYLTIAHGSTEEQLMQSEQLHTCEPGRITDWGIQCRTCNETIPLGTRLDPRFADFFAFLKPGSFRCLHGHTHTYDSDDVFFFSSSPETPVTEAGIQGNRANYELLSPPESTSWLNRRQSGSDRPADS
jgi:hypothetical protein